MVSGQERLPAGSFLVEALQLDHGSLFSPDLLLDREKLVVILGPHGGRLQPFVPLPDCFFAGMVAELDLQYHGIPAVDRVFTDHRDGIILRGCLKALHGSREGHALNNVAQPSRVGGFVRVVPVVHLAAIGFPFGEIYGYVVRRDVSHFSLPGVVLIRH